MIRTRELTRSFGGHTAVDRLTATVEPGRITGLLGANGAGKTTTLSMLTTLLPPTSGSAEIAGHDVLDDPMAVRRSLGYVPEHGSVFEGLTADEYLELAGRVHQLDPAAIAERADRWLGYLELVEGRNRRLGTFSKGMRRKVLVVAALLHEPEVLLLDEPMDGLDVVAQHRLATLLRERAEAGNTVLYSSHILEQVESHCDDLVILHRGRLLWQGPLGELRRESPGKPLGEVFLERIEEADRHAPPVGTPV